MIIAIDVHYKNSNAVVAGIGFENWNSKTESHVWKSSLNDIAPYEPGRFYRRELPCITALLDDHSIKPGIIIIDGFVWLDGNCKPGLGVHLYKELDKSIPVIGVAKQGFKGISEEFALYRGQSKKPLFITSIGIDTKEAINNIKAMAGVNRLPILLKKVDRLCREN